MISHLPSPTRTKTASVGVDDCRAPSIQLFNSIISHHQKLSSSSSSYLYFLLCLLHYIKYQDICFIRTNERQFLTCDSFPACECEKEIEYCTHILTHLNDLTCTSDNPPIPRSSSSAKQLKKEKPTRTQTRTARRVSSRNRISSRITSPDIPESTNFPR